MDAVTVVNAEDPLDEECQREGRKSARPPKYCSAAKVFKNDDCRFYEITAFWQVIGHKIFYLNQIILLKKWSGQKSLFATYQPLVTPCQIVKIATPLLL